MMSYQRLDFQYQVDELGSLIMTDATFVSRQTGFSGFIRWMKRKLEQEACRQRLQAQVRRERKELLGLDERELRDIGVTREQAVAEGSRRDDDLPIGRNADCNGRH